MSLKANFDLLYLKTVSFQSVQLLYFSIDLCDFIFFQWQFALMYKISELRAEHIKEALDQNSILGRYLFPSSLAVL